MEPRGVERRLTTILSADVVGYSRLMGKDEAGTLAALKAHRRELIDPKAAQYHGRTVKLMGDGALMEFTSVVDAVLFAVEVQCAMRERNAGVPEDRRILFRIGINIGDVIIEGDDIYGDGVNVASRLENLAEPGGICMARNVRNQVRDKLHLDLNDLGEVEVKNIARPVHVFHLVLNEKAHSLITPVIRQESSARRRAWPIAAALAGVIVVTTLLVPLLSPDWFGAGQPVAGDGWPTVVIRPFRATQGDGAVSLAASLTDEVVARLGRFPLLHVAFDTDGTPPAGNYVLSGSVHTSPDLIGASIQLSDMQADTIAFSQTYTRNHKGRRRIEAEHDLAAQIATDVGSSFSGAIGAVEFKRASTKPINQLTPYECYLYGLRVFGSGDDRTTRGARTCLEARVEADADDATAWALLGSTYAHQRWWARGLESPEKDHIDNRVHLVDKARDAATRADALAEGRNPIVYFAIGRALYAACERDKIVPVAERAISLNPADANVLGSFGNWVPYVTHWEHGMEWAKEAVRLAPETYAKWWWWAIGKYSWYTGNYEEALHAWGKAHQEDLWLTHMYLAMTYAPMGRLEDARAAAKRLLELKPDLTIALAQDYYRMWCFSEDYIAKLQKDLRLAGVPDW